MLKKPLLRRKSVSAGHVKMDGNKEATQHNTSENITASSHFINLYPHISKCGS